jgi:hypothetical protein
MMKTLVSILASVSFTGCLTESEPAPRGQDRQTKPSGPGDMQPAPTPPTEHPIARSADQDAPDQVSICERIVATEGPCAYVCDPESLARYIPAGSCVSFACDLDDGSLYRTGGCNP